MIEAAFLLLTALSPGTWPAPQSALPAVQEARRANPSAEPVVCVIDEESGAREPAPDSCSIAAVRVSGEGTPVLDGRLDEEVWRRAPYATGFRQQEPTPGARASQVTEARVVYSDDAVYVGMRLRDARPDSIRAQFVRRDDRAAASDWASVMIDSYLDRRTSFEFATTPTGTRLDVLHLEDDREDVAWDAVWDVATRVDGEGWVAEFRIPLSQLRFSDGEALTWGVNFSRTIARNSELSHWAPIPPGAGRHVSLYGDLVELEDLSPPGGLELIPYTLGRVTRAPGETADPFYQENDLWGTLGLDMKYGLTSNLTLTATVNPDFGQVEADPSEVNLTAFETFFAERRPFFTEGTEIFGFRIPPEGQAFYSRRIGRPPQLRPSVPADGFSDAAETARILGAVKLSGKTSGGWSLGLLNAVTGEVTAEVAGPEGIQRQPVEPRTNYAAARVIRDFRDGASGLGVVATATNRRLSAPELERLRSASYLGGFDFWHRFGPGNNYETTGWFVGTHARGSEDAMARTQRSASHFFTRPDADHLTYDPTRTTINGWAAEYVVRKRGGGNFTWTLSSGARSPGVELNDLGFLSYADIWYGSVIGTYEQFDPGPRFRNWYVRAGVTQGQTFGLENVRSSLGVTGRVTFLNFWRLTLTTSHWLDHKWPWDLRGGPALRRSGYSNVDWSLASDSRKSWGLTLRGENRLDYQGGAWRFTLDPAVDFRPTDRATVSVGPVYSRVVDADQYVTRVTLDEEPVYVVGKVDQTTLALEARVSYGFSATLNLDLYAQPFISTGSYSAFRTVADPGEADFDRRLPLIPAGSLTYDPETNRYATPDYSFGNPDFNVREFRLNAVLRWEYLPGSTVYAVWTQARRDDQRLGDLSPGRDWNRLFSAPSTDVFMIKVSYWMGL